ncbi:hypothetical protein WN944_016186 [Citrus x changshan-huyou]|uniref:Uncharacterized protein n=1 Tax=Citrus x changshan-huyou TaxID=2935761 RepID=A0AAP0MFB8_9ROSI
MRGWNNLFGNREVSWLKSDNKALGKSQHRSNRWSTTPEHIKRVEESIVKSWNQNFARDSKVKESAGICFPGYNEHEFPVKHRQSWLKSDNKALGKSQHRSNRWSTTPEHIKRVEESIVKSWNQNFARDSKVKEYVHSCFLREGYYHSQWERDPILKLELKRIELSKEYLEESRCFKEGRKMFPTLRTRKSIVLLNGILKPGELGGMDVGTSACLRCRHAHVNLSSSPSQLCQLVIVAVASLSQFIPSPSC